MRKLKKLAIMMMIVAMVFTGCGGENEVSDSQTDNDQGNVNDNKVYTMRMPELISTQNPSHIGAVWLSEQLAERSNGRIDLQIFPNGELAGSDREIVEMTRAGTTQFVLSPTFTMAAMDPDLKKFNIFDIPYMFLNDEQIEKFLASEFGKELQSLTLEKAGLRSYGAYHGGTNVVATIKGPVLSPDDLVGSNIRVLSSPTTVALVNAWGGNPTPIAWSEVFTALQQGVVEGLMTRGPNILDAKLNEVTNYMADVKSSYFLYFPVVNEDFYQSMPPDLQQIFDECVKDYIVHTGNLEAENKDKAYQKMREGGLEITEYTDEELKPFIDAVVPTWDGLADQVGGKEYLDSVIEFLHN